MQRGTGVSSVFLSLRISAFLSVSLLTHRRRISSMEAMSNPPQEPSPSNSIGESAAPAVSHPPQRVMPELPPVPRQLTARARRRAWNEPRVRFLWIAAIVLFGAACYIAVLQTTQWQHDMRLVRSGTVVSAYVVEADGAAHAGPEFTPPVSVKIKYDLDGKSHTVTGIIQAGEGPRYVSPRTNLPIRVDPDHPEDWTARDHLSSIFRELLGAGLVLIVVLLTLLVTLLVRQRVLRIWRDGQILQAVVIQCAHSAMAPRSQAIRCALRDHPDKRLFTVFIPYSAARLSPGDALQLIAPPNHPERAIPAMLYHD